MQLIDEIVTEISIHNVDPVINNIISSQLGVFVLVSPSSVANLENVFCNMSRF